MSNGRGQFSHCLDACYLREFILRFQQGILRALSVLDVGRRSIPPNNFSVLITEWHRADQEPAVCPVRPPEPRLSLERLSCRKGCAPFLRCAIFGMKGFHHPAPAQSHFPREPRVRAETLIQKISRAVGQFTPH